MFVSFSEYLKFNRIPVTLKFFFENSRPAFYHRLGHDTALKQS